ncbi:TPA: hypothetical protein ACM5J7_004557, partial [Escherichia coli]
SCVFAGKFTLIVWGFVVMYICSGKSRFSFIVFPYFLNHCEPNDLRGDVVFFLVLDTGVTFLLSSNTGLVDSIYLVFNLLLYSRNLRYG